MTFDLIRKHVTAAVYLLDQADTTRSEEAREARQLLAQARTVARARKPLVRSTDGLAGALTDVTDGGQVRVEGAHGVTMVDVTELTEVAA